MNLLVTIVWYSSCLKSIDTIFILVTVNFHIVSQVLTLDIFVILVSSIGPLNLLFH